MIRRTAASILLLALVLAGCAPGARSGSGRLPDLLPPVLSLEPSSATVSRFDPPGTGASLSVTVPLTVTNPNPFPLQVHGVGYVYTVGSTPTAEQSGQVETRLMLLPGGSQQVALELPASLQADNRLLSEAAASFQSGGLAWGVSGAVTYSSERHPWQSSVQFSRSGRTGAGTGVLAPEFSLADPASIFSLDGTGAVIRVVLDVNNPGPAGWLLHAKDLMLQLNGEPVAIQDLPPTPVAAGSSARVVLTFSPVSALLSSTVRSGLSDALAGQPATALLSGDIAYDVLGLSSFALPGGLQLSVPLQSH